MLAVWPSSGRCICSRWPTAALWAVGAAPVARKEKQASDNVVHLGPKGAWPMTRKALACKVSALCTGLCQRNAAVRSVRCTAFPPHMYRPRWKAASDRQDLSWRGQCQRPPGLEQT